VTPDWSLGLDISRFYTEAPLSEIGIDEIQKWRNGPLREEYAVVSLDAMMFPIKRDKAENESINE